MSMTSIGDLARTFHSSTMTSRLKSDLDRLSQELVTGQKADMSLAVSGDFGPIAHIERLLSTMDARTTAVTEATTFADMAQATLEFVQGTVEDKSTALLSLAGNAASASKEVEALEARELFASIVNALNTTAAGRSLFAGAAIDQPALADPDTILSALAADVAGETTAAGLSAAVDAWFQDTGGGFETIAYQGDASPMGPIPLGEGETVVLDVTARDPALRQALAAMAKAALVAEGALAGAPDERGTLLVTAGQDLLNAADSLTTERAALGMVQARLEDVAARNEAERAALELTRSELVGVDQYEAATALEAAYTQLESLYTVTARISRLNFTDYL